MRGLRHTAFWLTLFSPFAALAASSATPGKTTITLMAEQSVVTRGEQEGISAGVLIEPEEGWHIYWENPGDSGLAPTLEWQLPQGFTASGIDWPPPHQLNEGDLATYSYEGPTLLPVTIQPPAGLEANDVTLKVKVELLVCKDICIPETAGLELTLPVGDRPAQPSPSATWFDRHDQIRARKLEQPGTYGVDESGLTLRLPLAALGLAQENRVHAVHFYTREPNVVQYAAPQQFELANDQLSITIPKAQDGEMPDTVTGILTIIPRAEQPLAFNATFTRSGSATSTPGAPGAGENMLFSVALLLALAGGLILNLMPCVLPVLSLKAIALAKKAGRGHAQVCAQGISYTLGILISFAAISGVLLVLRSGGEAVGWGYQMQSPTFVATLIYLLFLVGLSLSGMFHLPVLLGNIGTKITSETSSKGSFFTGMLATAVATPCTAPFMAPAVGAALTMPAWQSMLVFQALGLGLALPYLLISLFPSLRAFLPKPGAWMDTFKQLMAFPMYASVVWLLWVLTLQSGVPGMVMALSALLAMTFIIWMRRVFPSESRTYQPLALLAMIVLAAATLPSYSFMETPTPMPPAASEEAVQTVPYDKATLDQLRQQGKPVFVDATAAWCITCQVNASVALHTPRTMKKFKELGITLMIADWTRRNPEITEFLAGFGFNGVPLNVYYPPMQGQPVVLPQLLSEDIVIQTISKGE